MLSRPSESQASTLLPESARNCQTARFPMSKSASASIPALAKSKISVLNFFRYLQPSIGFGGSCLEKDVLALIYLAESLGLDDVADYWNTVINFNINQMDYFVKKIIKGMFNNVKGKSLCMLGVAFKQGTNDARNSPALYVCMKLLVEGGTLKIYDPKVERTHFINEMSWK
jgi:UDPglucose 6-dehydrogenase